MLKGTRLSVFEVNNYSTILFPATGMFQVQGNSSMSEELCQSSTQIPKGQHYIQSIARKNEELQQWCEGMGILNSKFTSEIILHFASKTIHFKYFSCNFIR